jgi:hypothetical protein
MNENLRLKSIGDFMKIIPTIQSYLPYIVVISSDELGNIIKDNLDKYFRKIK